MAFLQLPHLGFYRRGSLQSVLEDFQKIVAKLLIWSLPTIENKHWRLWSEQRNCDILFEGYWNFTFPSFSHVLENAHFYVSGLTLWTVSMSRMLLKDYWDSSSKFWSIKLGPECIIVSSYLVSSLVSSELFLKIYLFCNVISHSWSNWYPILMRMAGQNWPCFRFPLPNFCEWFSLGACDTWDLFMVCSFISRSLPSNRIIRYFISTSKIVPKISSSF